VRSERSSDDTYLELVEENVSAAEKGVKFRQFTPFTQPKSQHSLSTNDNFGNAPTRKLGAIQAALNGTAKSYRSK